MNDNEITIRFAPHEYCGAYRVSDRKKVICPMVGRLDNGQDGFIPVCKIDGGYANFGEKCHIRDRGRLAGKKIVKVIK